MEAKCETYCGKTSTAAASSAAFSVSQPNTFAASGPLAARVTEAEDAPSAKKGWWDVVQG